MAHTDPHHPTHGHHGPGHAHAVGHETTDASLGGVERFMVVLFLFLAACFLIVWGMFQYLASRAQAGDVQPSAVTGRTGDRLPPLPRLQTVPYGDLASFRRAEDAALNGWAWTDPGKSYARIPVARAIEILAEQGLPVPPPSAAPPGPGAAPAPAPASQPGGPPAAPTASRAAQPGPR
jgi:hypothetical protein